MGVTLRKIFSKQTEMQGRGLFYFLCFVSMLFFFGGTGDHGLRSVKELWNLGHIGFFAVFSIFMLRQFEKSDHSPMFVLMVIFLAAAATGFSVEVIQGAVGRDFDWVDFRRDLAGAAAGLSIYMKFRGRLFKMAVSTLVLFWIFLESLPFALAVSDEINAAREFPVLSGLESSLELSRWKGDTSFVRDKNVASSGKYSLRVSLDTTRYSGIALKYFAGDWHGFDFFSFSVFNPLAAPLNLTCRVHDSHHHLSGQAYRDRFNKTFSLSRGWNNIEIPVSDIESAPQRRKMDLSSIESIGFFVCSLPFPGTIYIDDVKLKKII